MMYLPIKQCDKKRLTWFFNRLSESIFLIKHYTLTACKMCVFSKVSFLIITGVFYQSAFADENIPIANADFEAQALTDGNYTRNDIQGWQTSGQRNGVWNPSGDPLNGATPTTAYIDMGGTISQTLTTIFGANINLEMTFKIGGGAFTDGISSWEARLYAGDTVIGKVDNTDFDPPDNKLIDASLSLTAAQLALYSAEYGKALKIEFYDLGNADNWDNTDNVYFDDVVLTKTALAFIADGNLILTNAQQSSTRAAGGEASRAIDGNTSGVFSNSSVTHTNISNEFQPWWQAEFDNLKEVKQIKLYNRTDCCPDRLSNFYVLISKVPFESNSLTTLLADTENVTYQLFSGTAGSPTILNFNNAVGKYVRVQLASNNIMSIAEVVIEGGEHLPSLSLMNASQSSTQGPRPATKAIDGNTSGNAMNGEVTHTQLDTEAWWQAEFDALKQVHKVKVYNRTDCCSERLSDFYVFVSKVPFGTSTLSELLADTNNITSIYTSGQASEITTLDFNGAIGKYIRVQLVGTNYLSIAEVEINGIHSKASFAKINFSAANNEYGGYYNAPNSPHGSAFAVLKADGAISAWGDTTSGGSGAPSDTDYSIIYANRAAFAALKFDGAISVWGDSSYGGSGAPTDAGYTKIYSTFNAFAALKANGSISVWGSSPD
ncbi:MAG: discoidin domain-containing protein, partial [Saprospiraceae bacterium]|nr:discoidin domain-containing protein [Saprospiraceae bacterium]